jgi:hypothetical protein
MAQAWAATASFFTGAAAVEPTALLATRKEASNQRANKADRQAFMPIILSSTIRCRVKRHSLTFVIPTSRLAGGKFREE